VGWLVTFLLTSVVLTYIEGPRPRGWHLAGWAIVFGLFAALNPLRFTRRGRMATAVVAGLVLAGAAYASFAHLGARDASFLSGVVLGVPSLVAGLYLMFRG
jgi:hypothetical protein